MTAQHFANNYITTLTADVALGDPAIPVQSVLIAPATPFTVLVDAELMLVTGITGNNMSVQRAQEGTTATTHQTGAQVKQEFTLAGLNSLADGYFPYWGVSGMPGAGAGRFLGVVTTTPPSPPSGVGGAMPNDYVVDLTLGALWVYTGGVGGWRSRTAVIEAPWTAYTPTWTTDGAAPSIGNGVLSGRYKIIGKTMHLSIFLSAGSTTNGGTGHYFLSLPPGITISSGSTEQTLLAKFFLPPYANVTGFAYYQAGNSSFGNLYVTAGTTSAAAAGTMQPFNQNIPANGGVPNFGIADYPFKVNANIGINGTLEIN